MSDDQIKWVVTADDKDVIAAFKRMQKELETVKQKQKQANDEAKKGASESGKFLKEGVGELRNMVGQWVSVGTVVGLAASAYQNLRAETEKLGQAHQKLAQDITRTISKSGDLANGARIESALGSINGATREQAAAAFSGVSSAAPGLALGQRLALTTEVAKQAPTGADLNQLGNITAKVANLMPGKSANDVSDIVAAMRQRTGEDFSRVGGDEFEASTAKLIAAGMSPEQAMSIGLAGVEANLPSKAISGIAGAMVESDPNAGKRRGPMSKEDRLKSAFYKLAPQERFSKLAADPATAEAVLGANGSLNMKLIGDTKSQQQFLREAQAGDFATGQLKQLGGFQAGREALREQETAVNFEQKTRARAMEEAQFQRAAQFARAENSNRNPLSRLRIETEIKGVGFGARGGDVDNFNNQSSSDALLQGMRQMGYLTEQQIKHFQAQEKQNSEMIAELKKANSKPPQKNVDRHTE
jgi:hypothetical protein